MIKPRHGCGLEKGEEGMHFLKAFGGLSNQSLAAA